MPRPLTLLTGASRGLGLALAADVLQRGHRLLTLSRQPTPLAPPPGAELIAWQADLADPVPVARRLALWLADQDPGALASVTLIHNAGVFATPAPLQSGRLSELSHALRVGLEAPLLLSSAFLQATAAWTVPRKLLMVSSGLGRRAIAGSASYCAAKAGLDHLARVLALEQRDLPNGARVVSLAPGVIDTDMQQQLRSADPLQFPEQASFAKLHASGSLDSPRAAAARLLAYLDRPEFGEQAVADVRQPLAPRP